MKFLRSWTSREKWMMCIILLLIAVLVAGSKPVLAEIYAVLTPEQLYQKAVDASQNDQLALATANLYAYIVSYPNDYAKNIQGHRDQVNKVFSEWMATIQEDRDLARNVREHMEVCDQYPCKNNQSHAGLSTSYSQLFPSDLVKVCEDSNQRGKCSFLTVGEYDQWRELGVRNDSISSVEVGADVQILLCAHNLRLTSECILLTRSDSNLNNNYTAKGYSINDTVSTAKVTYRSGSGMTLPDSP